MPTTFNGVTANTLTVLADEDMVVTRNARINAVGDGIQMNGEGRVVVDGTVISSVDGIDSASGDVVVITQNGLVVADDDGIDARPDLNGSLTIHGTVVAADNGVVLRGAESLLVVGATGVIQGGSATDDDGNAGIFFASDSSTVINHGTIIGERQSDDGARFGLQAESGSVERIVNTGLIVGEVFLAEDNDTYDGRGGGVVDGIVNLGDGQDRGLGGAAADNIRGAAGADTLKGGGGDDTLDGDNGGDVIHGGDGDDMTRGGGGNDTIYSGTGSDTVNGGSGNDTLHGGVGNDSMDGGSGNDLMTDGAGADFVFGNGFNDTLRAVADGDDDALDGGFGTDTIEFLAGDGLLVDFASGTAFSVRQGTDTFANFEVIRTGGGDDVFVGDAGGAQIFGGGGNDDFSGFGSADAFFGGAGNDMMRGGGGNDSLSGGAGDDTLRGSAGADTYLFENGFGRDVVEDFSTSTSGEQIDLSAVGAITNFTDLQNNHLSDVGGVATISVGGNTITLLGVASAQLNAGDFVF